MKEKILAFLACIVIVVGIVVLATYEPKSIKNNTQYFVDNTQQFIESGYLLDIPNEIMALNSEEDETYDLLIANIDHKNKIIHFYFSGKQIPSHVLVPINDTTRGRIRINADSVLNAREVINAPKHIKKKSPNWEKDI